MLYLIHYFDDYMRIKSSIMIICHLYNLRELIKSLFTLSGTPPTVFQKGIQHTIYSTTHRPPQEVRLDGVDKVNNSVHNTGKK